MPVKESIHVIIHSSSKFNIKAAKGRGAWASTFKGNVTLEDYFKDSVVYLYFTKYNTGIFYGVAKMAGVPNIPPEKGLWKEDKYGMMFKIHWINAQREIEIPGSVGEILDTKIMDEEMGKCLLKQFAGNLGDADINKYLGIDGITKYFGAKKKQ